MTVCWNNRVIKFRRSHGYAFVVQPHWATHIGTYRDIWWWITGRPNTGWNTISPSSTTMDEQRWSLTIWLSNLDLQKRLKRSSWTNTKTEMIHWPISRMDGLVKSTRKSWRLMRSWRSGNTDRQAWVHPSGLSSDEPCVPFIWVRYGLEVFLHGYNTPSRSWPTQAPHTVFGHISYLASEDRNIPRFSTLKRGMLRF